MKIERVKKTNKNTTKSRLVLWILIAFLFGGIIGYGAHYVVVNWNGFFAVCPDGNNPDKNGCCAGEIYTDAGDGWMVCCPSDVTQNCFPPIK